MQKTEEHRKKLSLASKKAWKNNRQKFMDGLKKRNLKGKNNPWYGCKHTEETKKKMRENHADVSGVNCHFYIDGRTELHILIRNLKEYDNWRKQVFQRDRYTCQKCAKTGIYVEPHHKKSFSLLLKDFLKKHYNFSPIKHKNILIKLAMLHEPFWNVNNGQTLCSECHAKTDTYKKNRTVKHAI